MKMIFFYQNILQHFVSYFESCTLGFEECKTDKNLTLDDFVQSDKI